VIYDKIKEAIRKAMLKIHQLTTSEAGMYHAKTDKHIMAIYPMLFSNGKYAVQLSIQTLHEDGRVACREVTMTPEALTCLYAVMCKYFNDAMKEEANPAEFGGAE